MRLRPLRRAGPVLVQEDVRATQRPTRLVTATILAIGALASLAQASEAASLCGRSARSQTELYFQIAKSPFATLLRANDSETVLDDGETGTLWTFVVRPVSAVLCTSKAAPAIESRCDGEVKVCEALIRRLSADPRALP